MNVKNSGWFLYTNHKLLQDSTLHEPVWTLVSVDSQAVIKILSQRDKMPYDSCNN